MVRMSMCYLRFLPIRTHIKMVQLGNWESGCVIVIVILNCIIFSFASHGSVLAFSAFALVITFLAVFLDADHFLSEILEQPNSVL